MKEITSALVASFDFIFAPITAMSPIASLFIISVALTAIILAINRALVDKDIVKHLKDRMEEIREELTKAQKSGDNEAANKALNELLGVNSAYMKQTFKVLIASLVIITIFLPWLRYEYSGAVVATLPFNLPMVGTKLNWILWYVLVSFTIGWIVRKLLGMD